MKLLTLLAALLAGLFSLPAQAQGVTIGAAGAPDASAALEVRTTTQGLLLPRLTSVQRTAIASPAAGLLVFQTDGTPGVYYFDGSVWRSLTTGTEPGQLGGTVSTLAGTGTAGLVNGAGNTAAQFSQLDGVACDASGNVYVADQGNQRIRRIVVATGVVTTLAGGGSGGYLDGTGTAARFSNPFGVACDASGNVYVADYANNRIRRIVAATGVVTTLAGSGVAGYADGTGPAAQFNLPYGIACEASGNLYVTDRSNHRVRRIVAATGVVTTLAGSGTQGFADGTGPAAQFNFPHGVACDASGNLYVADENNQRIRRIVVGTGAVSTLAGSGAAGYLDGTGPAARFNYPSGVACDGNGNVYVADQNNNRIRRIVVATGAVSTLAGNSAAGYADGTGPAAQFDSPSGVACDANGTLYVTDQNNFRVRVVR